MEGKLRTRTILCPGGPNFLCILGYLPGLGQAPQLSPFEGRANPQALHLGIIGDESGREEPHRNFLS